MRPTPSPGCGGLFRVCPALCAAPGALRPRREHQARQPSWVGGAQRRSQCEHRAEQGDEFDDGKEPGDRAGEAFAEGEADLYIRRGPTMEWDTCAGQAILEAAGGSVLTLEGQPLRYGKPQRLNHGFIARGRPSELDVHLPSGTP